MQTDLPTHWGQLGWKDGEQRVMWGFPASVTSFMAVYLPAKFSVSEIAFILGHNLYRGNQNSPSDIPGCGVYFIAGFCSLSSPWMGSSIAQLGSFSLNV